MTNRGLPITKSKTMEVKDIIKEVRPVEPYCFETDNEETWYKIGVHDCFDYFENNRLKACKSQTPEQTWREAEFVVPFVKKYHRQPTYSDAIEITRKQMIEKAIEWIRSNIRPYYSDVKYKYDDFCKAMEE